MEFRDGERLLDLVSLKLELEAEPGIKVDVLTYNVPDPPLKRALWKSRRLFLRAYWCAIIFPLFPDKFIYYGTINTIW